MCETSFSPISPLPVNLVMTFHQYSELTKLILDSDPEMDPGIPTN